MKYIRLLIILAAFLIMISSTLVLFETTNRMPVYINIAAMFVLCVVVSIMNFNKKKEK